MTNLFVAPTFLCAAIQVAAIKAGHYGDGGDHVLLVANNSSVPEVSDSFMDGPGFRALAEHFREVRLLNDLISPYHPRSYNPDHVGRRLLRRDIERAFDVESFETITSSSAQERPARTLFRLFPEARITVVSDGLTVYGPTPGAFSPSMRKKIDRLIYLDLIPGLNPVLLSELDVPQLSIPADLLREVVSHVALCADDEIAAVGGGPVGLVLGQHLAALGVLSTREQEDFNIEMLRAAAGLGVSAVIFKTHPAAPPSPTKRLRAAAVELKLGLQVVTTAAPVEVLLELLAPKFVMGSFSTGLSTARVLFGARAITWGTESLVLRLPLQADSNRVPMAISYLTLEHVDGAVGQRAAQPDPVDLDLVVRALSQHMRPERYPPAITDGEFSEMLELRSDLRPFFGRGGGVELTANPHEESPLVPKRRGLVDRVRVLSYRVQGALPPRLRQPVRNLRAKVLSLK